MHLALGDGDVMEMKFGVCQIILFVDKSFFTSIALFKTSLNKFTSILGNNELF